MSRRGYDDRDYYRDSGPLPVRTREYEERGTYSRPTFLDSDYGRSDAGAMVLRDREETVVRQRPRSVSPVRVHERRYVERSPTPPDYARTRIVERERERRRSPSPQLRARVVETRERIRERSPSPVRVQERYVERRIERSPSPVDRVRIRNIEERETIKQPIPEPAPRPPSPIRAPPIHQEVITHHRHIDHGFERAPAPIPPPAPVRQTRVKETDIDIYSSRNHTDVDITRRTTEDRSIARSRTPAPTTVVRREHFHDDSYIYEAERDRLRVSDTRVDLSRRRSLSARPVVRDRSRERVRVDIRDSESEADYYARKANERAFIGEAYNGATKDWTIIDVPPGTERVRMDGVGGGSQEITWQKYNGVRRSRFIPERERESISSASSSTVRDRVEVRETDLIAAPTRDTTTLDIEISSRRRGGGREYEREYERIEERDGDRRVGLPRKQKVTQDLWTEITKDLVTREAIEELGYDFEETDFFFYIIQYLRYEDVLELVQLTEQIRRERHYRAREIEWERQHMDRRDRLYVDDVRERVWDGRGRYDDERVTEREVIYASTGGRAPRRSGGW